MSKAKTAAAIVPVRGGSLLTMVVISVGSVLSTLDLFIVNLAFSAIHHSFPSTSPQQLSWIVSGYSVAFAALLVPGGRMADRFGRRRVFRLGMALFAASSAACAWAPDAAWLVGGRVVQGFAAALMVPTSLGLVLHTYPPERHGRMVGIWVACGAAAASLGPVLGGLLIALSWRWVFLINLPIALPALWLARSVPETPKELEGLPDLAGSACLLGGIAAAVAAISFAPDWGWSAWLWATLAAAAILLLLFVYRCRTAAHPAVDLRVFRAPASGVAAVGIMVFYAAFAMMLLGSSLFMIQVWHWTAEQAGLGFALGPATAGFSAVVAGRLGIAPRSMAFLGGAAFLAMGLWWLNALGPDPNYAVAFLPGVILSGIGAGPAQTGFLSGGSAALSPTMYATGAGILNTARQIGAAVGAALFVAVSGSAQQVSDYRAAWILIAGCGLIAIVASFALSGPRRMQPKSVPNAILPPASA